MVDQVLVDYLNLGIEEVEKKLHAYRVIIANANNAKLAGQIVTPPPLPYVHRVGHEGYRIVDSPVHGGFESHVHIKDVELLAAAILAAVGNPRYAVIDFGPQEEDD